MRSFVLLMLVCSCSSPVPTCSTSADCSSGAVCASGRCVGGAGGGLSLTGGGSGGSGVTGGGLAAGGNAQGGGVSMGSVVMADAICRTLERCETQNGRLFVSPAACRAEQVYTLESLVPLWQPLFGGSFDGTKAAGCAQEVATVSCADAQTRPNGGFLGLFPWSLASPACAGLVSYGGLRTCVVSARAACDGVHTLCGLGFSCRAGRCEPMKAKGEACFTTGDCQPSLGCLPAGDGGYACSEWLALNAPCANPARSYDCVGALTCDGVCKPRAALGEACSNVFGSCLGGLACVGGRCAAVPGEGASCSGSCSASSCLSAGAGSDAGVCALLKPSTTCQFLFNGQATCGSFNVSAVSDGGSTCACVPVTRKLNGESCTRGDECAFPYLCETGRCVVPRNLPNGSSCRLARPGGEHSSNDFCASGVCDETRTCAPAVLCP